MGVYNADGYLVYTPVSGLVRTGIYNPNGTFNCVDRTNAVGFVGLYHPCGAYNVAVSSSSSYYAPNGAINVTPLGNGTFGQKSGNIVIPPWVPRGDSARTPVIGAQYTTQQYWNRGYQPNNTAFKTSAGGVFTRTTTKTYLNSTAVVSTAAINTEAFDFSPAAVVLGLSMEGPSTNLCLRSGDLSVLPWESIGVTPTAGSKLAPDGTMSGTLLNAATSANTHRQQITVTASTVYTWSFWVARGTATDLKWSAYNITAAANIVAETSYYAQTSVNWTRVQFTFTTPVGCTSVYIYTQRNGSAGTYYAWGGQLEAVAFATSYIPTAAAATVNRAQDFLAFGPTGGLPFNGYDQTQGAFIWEGDSAHINGVSPFECLLSISDGTANNLLQLALNSNGTISFVVIVAGVMQASITSAAMTLGVRFRVLVLWRLNQFEMWINGVKIGATDVSGTVPVVTLMRLGAQHNGGAPMFGHISQWWYFDVPPWGRAATLSTVGGV